MDEREIAKIEAHNRLQEKLREKREMRNGRTNFVRTKVSTKAGKRGNPNAVDPSVLNTKFEGHDVTDIAGLLEVFLQDPNKLKDYLRTVKIPRSTISQTLRKALGEKLDQEHENEKTKQIEILLDMLK